MWKHLIPIDLHDIVTQLLDYGFEYLGESSKYVWGDPKLEIDNFTMYQDMDNISVVCENEFFNLDIEDIDYQEASIVFDEIEALINQGLSAKNKQSTNNQNQLSLWF